MAMLRSSLEKTTLHPDQVEEIINKIEEFIRETKILLCNSLPLIPEATLTVGGVTLEMGRGYITICEKVSRDCILRYTVAVTPQE